MIFDKVLDLKKKFKSFFISKKKLKALENYSSVAPFKYKKSLSLIKHCLDEGFLNEKGADFLSSMLEEYELNFLDWAYRTKWLKSQMNEMSRNTPREVQMSLFDLDRTGVAPNIPVELLTKCTPKTYGRRV